eukprot:UC1_evm1s2096
MEHRFQTGRHQQQLSRDVAKEAAEAEKNRSLSGIGKLKIGSLNAGVDAKIYTNPLTRRLSSTDEVQQQRARDRELADEHRARKDKAESLEQERRKAAAAKEAELEAERQLAREAEARADAAAEEAAAVRVRKGMPVRIAAGRTTAARQELSHAEYRGRWVETPTHYGLLVGRWVGCRCGLDIRESWCTNYTGATPLEDEASANAQAQADKAIKSATADRIAKGMPPEVAAGETLQRRKWLSHTRNACPGTKDCGKRGRNSCQGEFLVDKARGVEAWTCCRAARRDF